MRFLCLLVCAILLVACSHFGATPLPSGTNPSLVPPIDARDSEHTAAYAGSSSTPSGPVLSFAKRTSVMQAVVHKFLTLPHKNPKKDFQVLASYMGRLHAFSKFGVSPTGVWGVFTDGRLYTFATDSTDAALKHRPSMDDTSIYAKQLEGNNDATAGKSVTAIKSNFPGRGLVEVLYDNLAGTDIDPKYSQQVVTALKETGYTGAQEAPATVDNFLALKNVAFLYVEGHAGFGELPNGQYYYLLKTATIPSAANDIKYGDYLKSNALGYESLAYLVPNPVRAIWFPITKNYYFLTKTFVRDVITFAPGGNDVVWNGACAGASSLQPAQDFIAALQGKGMAYYFGWTKEVINKDDEQSSAFFLDRALGGQQKDALAEYIFRPPGIQPQAPFPAGDVYDAMGRVYRAKTHTSGTLQESILGAHTWTGLSSIFLLPPYGQSIGYLQMIVTSVTTAPPLMLAPAITRIDVHEPYEFGYSQPKSELDMVGSFGSKPGKVTIGPLGGAGDELKHAKWTTGEIVVPIPPSGPDASGFVTVIGPTGIRSNAVPITMWTGTVNVSDTYTASAIAPPSGPAVEGSGKFTSAATLNVKFRADVHPWRDYVDTAPVPASLWFSNIMTSSTASITNAIGSFTGSQMGTPYKLAYAPPPALPIALSPNTSNPVTNSFEFGSLASEGVSPSGCSQAMNDGSGLPVCVVVEAGVTDAATCIDNPKGSLCTNGYGGPFGFNLNTLGYGERVGEIYLTMDPATYQVSMPKLTYPDSYNSFDWPAVFSGSGTTTITSSFNRPVSPPTPATPAIR